ncbi:MAG: fructose-1,6-bisphosphatase [Clostridiales bacterium]|jgi:fructose-1,6-bisphosphatase-3|nr:fructose-1,6-bisphosphatase [Clostridiales bacterium]
MPRIEPPPVKYLRLLGEKYPTIESVCTEIINLQAILNLPKGTEHFMSDLHGEYEAFNHILNNCSGVIREKVDNLFSGRLTQKQRAEFCALIYYPVLKLERYKESVEDMDEWRQITLFQLIDLCKAIAVKYTRSKVRKALPKEYSYIIDELLHGESGKSAYYQEIIKSIIALNRAEDFIIEMCALIKRLAVDHLHIVGDIFDRGPRADRIMDQLTKHHSVDIQWGNHDILWMGAGIGNHACAAQALLNSAAFGNLRILESGYGINLLGLALFADKTYARSARFESRVLPGSSMDEEDVELNSKIYKALAVMLFKLEGQIYTRRPEYGMRARMFLDKIDFAARTARIGENTYPMADMDLPTIDPENPYALSPEERKLISDLRDCFLQSDRLRAHIRFLYTKGSIYLISNQNLLFHGCIPMNEDGSFSKVTLCGATASGRAYLDNCDDVARAAFYGAGAEQSEASDAMWYLWCGQSSPLFGRSAMTTFERLFVADKSASVEVKNPYYTHIQHREQCERILKEFGLEGKASHIINGHVPVRVLEGESPLKGGGKLIVIDGGFSRAYQPVTGAAGYTLIFNSHGMRLSAHSPFESTLDAVEKNSDIYSSSAVFETLKERMLVKDADNGRQIAEQIKDLKALLNAYREGAVPEKSHNPDFRSPF